MIARTTRVSWACCPATRRCWASRPRGIVRIQQEDGGGELVFAVHGGFLSVTDDGVSILAELAQRADEIDVGRAQQALERARSAGDDDHEAGAAASRALSRLRAPGQPV